MSAVSQVFKKIGDQNGYKADHLLVTDGNRDLLLVPLPDRIPANADRTFSLSVKSDLSGYAFEDTIEKIEGTPFFNGNFSFHRIPNGRFISIPNYEMMIVNGNMTIEAGGELEVAAGGELVVFGD